MNQLRSILGACAAAALLASAQALADGALTSMRGDVRIGNTAAAANQRVLSGATITTGIGAQAIIKFDDQQQVVLDQNTTFRIADFRYRAQEPRGDRAVFDLLRGALRFITGVVGARNPNIVQLRVPQATIGVRGTDFMVAIVNPTYLSVLQGAVTATNTGGTATFRAGDLGVAADDATLTAAIQANALPAAASSAFGRLGALRMAPHASSGAAGKVTSPQVGQDAATRARELKEDLGRDRAKEAAEAARERARGNGSKPRPK